MNIQYFTATGNFRGNNEDAILIDKKVISMTDMEECQNEEIYTVKAIFAVADGMGGHPEGETAAKLTLETIAESVQNSNALSIEEILLKARDVLEGYAKKNPHTLGFGCAVAGVLLESDRATAFNVGDCRAYLLRKGELIKLTKDHTLFEEMVRNGLISDNQLEEHPYRNILTSAITGDGYKMEIKIHTETINIETDDKFLICSDGLWSEVNNEEIKLSLSSPNPCEALRKSMESRLQKDNFTFIVVQNPNNIKQ